MPHPDPLEQSSLRQAQDERNRFTLPTDIPDAAYWTKDGTFEEAVRRRAAAPSWVSRTMPSLVKSCATPAKTAPPASARC